MVKGILKCFNVKTFPPSGTGIGCCNKGNKVNYAMLVNKVNESVVTADSFDSLKPEAKHMLVGESQLAIAHSTVVALASTE